MNREELNWLAGAIADGVKIRAGIQSDLDFCQSKLTEERRNNRKMGHALNGYDLDITEIRLALEKYDKAPEANGQRMTTTEFIAEVRTVLARPHPKMRPQDDGIPF